ncbi:hypothetical protein IOK49_01510 [Fervidicoccus fontis]|uniref:Asparagine synthetase domain-containing protein n=1 Tax=Fervidicoccus fontis TaxID=683846 RepID=A0A843A7I7_9CREN|nr:asparagine synthase-related protein [Fervidicoccus fontis]MBE9390763.1 hypothetical protein [Fervidicoccus fontis]
MRIKAPCWYYGEELLKMLRRAVKKSGCDCIALSGGIDSSLVLLASLLEGIKPKGYIAVYRGGLPKDIAFANYLSKKFNIDAELVFIEPYRSEDLRKSITECIGEENLNSHLDGGCIEFRNDAVFYSVIKKARDDRCRCIYTGSGGDELFAGYSFLLSLGEEDLDNSIRMLSYGRFPELEIAKCLNMNAFSPFLDESIRDLSLQIPIYCLRSSRMMRKEILREILGESWLGMIAERMKAPAESGSGTKDMCISRFDERFLPLIFFQDLEGQPSILQHVVVVVEEYVDLFRL